MRLARVMADTEADLRRVPIPSQRYNQLRSNWPKITAPIVEQLKLQIRLVVRSLAHINL